GRWLPADTHGSLDLGLPLALVEAELLALLAPARHMEQFDYAGHEAPEIAPGGKGRRPAIFRGFFRYQAAVLPRFKGLDPGGEVGLAERLRDQSEGGAEAAIDPDALALVIAHQRPALHRLQLELRPRAKVCNRADMVELGPPAPLIVFVKCLRIGAIVVME